MSVGAASITGLALILGIWLYWHKNAPKITILLFLVAGLGIGRVAGTFFGAGLDLALGTVGSAGRLIGVSAATIVAGLAVVLTLEVVWKGLWFKKAKPQRYHPWLALALPSVVVAAGVPILTTVMNTFSNAVTTVGANLS